MSAASSAPSVVPVVPVVPAPPRPGRLLVLSPRKPETLSGAEVSLMALCRWLFGRGWEIHVVTQEANPGPAGGQDGNLDGIQVHYGRRPDLRDWCAALRPTVVLGQLGWIRKPMAEVRSRGVVTVGLVHMLADLLEAERQPEVLNLLVVNSEELRRKASDRFRRVELVHPPLGGLERWRGGRRSGTPWTCTLINLCEGKGSMLFHRLAGALPTSVRMIGVRGGYGRQKWGSQPPPNVVYRDAQPRIATIYAETDVLLMPSVQESFGMTAREALLQGIPVIASDLPGLREATGGCSEAVQLLPPHDVAAWEQAVRRWMDPSAYQQASEAASRVSAGWLAQEQEQLLNFERALSEAIEQHGGRVEILPAPETLAPLLPTSSPQPPRRAPAPFPSLSPAPSPERPGQARRASGLRSVLLVTSRMWPVAMGGEMTWRARLEQLSAAGIEVGCLYSDGDPPPGDVVCGVRYHHRPGTSAEQLAEEAGRLVGCNGVLVVHDRRCWEACSRLPQRKVATVHYWTGLLAEPRQAHRDRTPAGDVVRILGRYDALLANSSFCRELLVDLGLPGERIAVVNPEPARAALVSRERSRRGVLVVGQRKMRPDVIAALRRHISPLGVLPYDGPGASTLSPEQMAELYDRAEVLAHPTFLTESYCRTVVEAMAHGLPVVYSDAGHPPRLVGRSAGIPLPMDAPPKRWIEAVEQARAWREQMGAAALRRAGWIAQHVDSGKDLLAALQSPRRPRDGHGLRTGAAAATILVPSYPGCWTAAQHLSAVHGCRLIRDPAEGWGDLLIIGSYHGEWLRQVPQWSQMSRVCLWWHSDLAQSDFSAELQWLKQAAEMVRRDELYAILPTSETLTEVLQGAGIRSFWLPDVLSPETIGSSVGYVPGSQPRVGLFAGTSVRKNHATSLGAASLAVAEVHCFPSLLRQPRLMALIEMLRLRVVTHDPPFDQKRALYDLLASCTATLHPSHGETFCYAAAESVQLGVPAISSGCVPCLQLVDGDDGLTRLVDDSDSIEIAHRIRLLHQDRDLRARVVRQQQLGLAEVVFCNELVSRRTLVEVLP